MKKVGRLKKKVGQAMKKIGHRRPEGDGSNGKRVRFVIDGERSDWKLGVLNWIMDRLIFAIGSFDFEARHGLLEYGPTLKKAGRSLIEL
jgi:hypothetical protein